jgi:hypothetical protein
MDLITSFIDFGLGYIELDAWMHVFHDCYVSAIMSVISFEAILVIWYLVSKKYEIARYGMLVWGLTKLYPIINNLLLLIFSF